MKYCSFGLNCFSSQLLKRLNLKNESYPFDWLHSNLDIVQDCLNDDFKTFLDKQYYSSWDWGDVTTDKSCNHKIYGEMAKMVFFRHKDPLSFNEDYEYYVRCVNRFRELLKSEEKKIFIYNEKFVDNETILKVVHFNNNLKKYTSNYQLISILHRVSNERSYSTIGGGETLKFLIFNTLTPSGGIKFDDDNDNLYMDDILKSIII